MAGTTKTRKTHGERGKYGGTKSVSPFRSRDCRRAKNKSRAARPAAWTRSCHGGKDPKSSADKKESTARRRASVHSDQGTAEPRQRPRCPQMDKTLQNTTWLTGIQHGRSQPEEQQRTSEPCQEHQPEGSGSCERKSILRMRSFLSISVDSFRT